MVGNQETFTDRIKAMVWAGIVLGLFFTWVYGWIMAWPWQRVIPILIFFILAVSTNPARDHLPKKGLSQ